MGEVSLLFELIPMCLPWDSVQSYTQYAGHGVIPVPGVWMIILGRGLSERDAYPRSDVP